MKIKHLLLIGAALCGLFVAADNSFAQGTAFTYQGLLGNSNNLVTGSYDFTFKLFNALSGPAQVGPAVTNLSVGVTNGLFITSMDFGAQFNGTPYWLEIGVQPHGGGGFTTLTPRQALTPTPYAITSENVNGPISANQLTGTVPAGVLAGVSGGGLTMLNASQLTTGTVPDARLSPNVALLDHNQTFTGTNIFNSSASGGRLIVQGTTIDTNLFTGLSLQYDANNGEGALVPSFNTGFDGSAELGFYTKAGPGQPIARTMLLNWYGTLALDQVDGNNGALNNGSQAGAGLTFGTTGGEGIASKRTVGGNQFGLDFYTSSNPRMSILYNGFVGIGTLSPSAQLHVVSPNVGTTNTGVFGSAQGGSPADTHPSGGFFSAAGEFAGPNGLIGAATTNQSGGFGVIGLAPGTGGRGVYGRATSGTGYGVYGESDSTNGVGVWAQGAGVGGTALMVSGGGIRVNGAGIGSGTAAFVQVCTTNNQTAAHRTTIDNPLCNGNSNAILLVTHNFNPGGAGGNVETHPFGVFYNSVSSKWEIYHADGAAMAAGTAFNVMITTP